MHKIVLVGGGGHCKSCIEVIESIRKFEIIGIIEKQDNKLKNVLGYKVIGNDNDLKQIKKIAQYAFVTIGQIKDSKPRIQTFDNLIKLNFSLPVIQSTNCVVSKHTKIGKGTILMRETQIGPNTSIGNNCIINNKVLIEHDCKIDNHCHISTGAILNGNVSIGHSSFVGSGVIISNNIKIGANVSIGAGVLVKKDISDNQVVR